MNKPNAEAVLKDSLKGSGIPDYMHGGIILYLMYGVLPGDFLTAVICNDLFEAIRRADDNNVRYLPEYVRFIYNYFPRDAYGDRETMQAYMESRRRLERPDVDFTHIETP